MPKKNSQSNNPKPRTANEEGIAHPTFAAGRVTAVILGGRPALDDPAYQMQIAELVTVRVVDAHQQFVSEAEKSLMSQVAILEAVITKHGLMLGIVHGDDVAQIADILLRAQNELRKTWLAIAEIRNPKKQPQFIKTLILQQLNQLKAELNVEQQVDGNQTSNTSPTASRSIEGGTYPAMDTLEEIDWSHLPTRQSNGSSQLG